MACKIKYNNMWYSEEEILQMINKRLAIRNVFESNHELANAVYEALGYGTSIIQDNKSYYRGQIEKPTIDKNGNLVLHAKEDELYKKAGLKSKGVSMTDDLQSAIEYGNGQLDVSKNLVSEENIGIDLERELDRLDENGYYLIQIPKNISNEIVKEAGEVKVIGDKIVIPKGQYKIEQVIDGVDTEKTPQQKQEAQELYSQYLEQIFPNSKVKDIVYHGSDTKFEGFLEDNLNYFGTQAIAKGYGKNLYPVVIEINKPYYEDGGNLSNQSYEDLYNKLDESGSDGFISNGKNLFIPKTEEQIHILGSQKDIEGFKNYVNRNISEVQYQIPQDREQEEFVASEKTIRDLAARMSDRIGIPIKYISDRRQQFKGKLEYGTAVINLAYATLDTPIHEILGHPIIRAIKNIRNANLYKEYDYSKSGWFVYGIEKEPIWTASEKEADDLINSVPTKNINSQLYQNLLKELEYGKGKEVLDRIKRDYKYKLDGNILINPYSLGGFIIFRNGVNVDYNKTWRSKEEAEKYVIDNFGRLYTLEEQQEEAIVELLGLMTAEKLDNVKDGKLISLLKRLLKEMKQFVRSLINQKEVEIDKLPDNMTLGDIADLLAYSNSKLILPGNEVVYTTPDNRQFKTYQEASNHISNLAKSVEDVDLSDVKINTSMPDSFELEVDMGVDERPNILKFTKENGQWYISDIWTGKNKIEEFEVIKYYQDKTGTYFGARQNNINNFIEKNKEYEQSKEIIEEWKKVNNIQYNPEEVYSRGQEFVSVVGAYSDFDVNLMMQNLLQHIEDNQKAGGEFTISAFTKPVDKTIWHLESGEGKIKFKIYPQPQDIKWAANTDVYSGSVWDASEKVSKDKKSELLGVSYTKYPSLSSTNSVQPNLAGIIDNLAYHHNELGISLTGSNFRLEYDENIPYSTKKIIDSINSILDQKYGKLVEPKISPYNITKFNSLDSRLSTLTLDEFDNIPVKSIMEIQDNEFLDIKNEVKIYKGKRYSIQIIEGDRANNVYESPYETSGTPIQPTQTNETLKESVDSVRSKFNTEIKDSEISSEESFTQNGWTYTFADWMDENEKFSKYKFIDGQIKTEYISKESFNQAKEEYLSKGKKEYTSQALINTKIAALKEVAKKYPRSLIRSEVRRINSNFSLGFTKDELPFQKIKESNEKLLLSPSSTPFSQREILLLTEETRGLYKQKNLLNRNGNIKIFKGGKAEAKRVAKSFNRTIGMDFDARKTPVGWKVFILKDEAKTPLLSPPNFKKVDSMEKLEEVLAYRDGVDSEGDVRFWDDLTTEEKIQNIQGFC